MTPEDELIERVEARFPTRAGQSVIVIESVINHVNDQRAIVALARKGRDDPSLDATDFAHPAWWRGEEHAVDVTCRKINEILDGKDAGHGTAREPWHSTRQRLVALARAKSGETQWNGAYTQEMTEEFTEAQFLVSRSPATVEEVLGPSVAFGLNIDTTQHPVGQFEPPDTPPTWPSAGQLRAACVAYVGGEGEWSRYSAGSKTQFRFKISAALSAAGPPPPSPERPELDALIEAARNLNTKLKMGAPARGVQNARDYLTLAAVAFARKEAGE